MGLDDTCNTTLVLGLVSTVKGDSPPSKNKPGLKVAGGFEPCLSLGLCNGLFIDTKGSMDHQPLYRQKSVTSSFCNDVVVKREREVETEKVSSRVSDVDDDGSISVSKKLRLNKDQSAVLEECFKMHSTLNPNQKQELARKLNLRARQVEVWFQNRRARTKLKQIEVDCEFLKKCCDALTDENRRLQKELQELKALKLAQPLYAHMPASTLTMCPSCERVNGGGDNKAPKSSLITASPKARFLVNPFANPSATC